MNNDKCSPRQIVSMMILFIFGSSLVLGSGTEAKQDAGAAIILAMLMAIILFLIYSRILNRFPSKDFFEILDIIYGKYIGWVLTVVFSWYFFHLGALVFRNFSEFIKVVSIPETPHYPILLVMGLLCAWMIKDGVEIMGRFALLTLPIVILNILVLLVFSLPLIKIDFVRPLFYNGFKPIFIGAFSTLTFPFAETVAFLFFLNKEKNKDGSCSKMFVVSILIAGSCMFVVTVRNILVLGIENISKLYFVSYSAISLINIGNFLQRVEVLVSVNFLFAGFIKTSVCIFVACKGVSKLFRIKEYKTIAAPVVLLMLHLACFVYGSTMEMFQWAREIYKYYASLFQIIIPILTLVIVEIRFLIGKKKIPA